MRPRSLLLLLGLPALALVTLGSCRGTSKGDLQEALEALPKNRPAAEHGVTRHPLPGSPWGELVALSAGPEGTRKVGAPLPVVLIHGTPATLYCWTELIFGTATRAGLAATRPTHALELPGHGIAPEGPPLGGFQDAADQVVSALEALELDQVHLVGHSYGGEVAFRAALDAPERIATLTLIDSSGIARPEGGFLPEEVEMREHPLANWGWLLNSSERITTALAPHFREIPPDRVEEFRLVCSNRSNWEAMIALVRDENGDREAELPNLEAPTLLIWGAEDIAYPPDRDGARFEELLPHGQLQVIEGSGHYPNEDQPERVLDLLEAHFAAFEAGSE